MVAGLHQPTLAFRTRVAAAWARVGPLEVAVALGCALAAATSTIGADSRWLSALGRVIVDRGSIPDGVPYASAPSTGWHNVPVLAELALHGLTSVAGDRGLQVAQVVAVAVGLAFVALDMRREDADDLGAALVLLVVVVGAISALVIVRSQLFSLALFPGMVVLLRAEARSPSARIWLLPPVFALWSNLHGAVLVGLAASSAYLVLQRARKEPVTALLVLMASALAICLTPALVQTPDYYLGVLRNEAARRGEGLWAPISLGSGFDLLLLAAAIALLVLALRRKPALWETIVIAALAVLTVRTARSGVWLLFFTAAPAARTLRFRSGRRWQPAGVSVAVACGLVALGLVRGPLPGGAGHSLLDEALLRADGTPILADPIPAEQVALAGGRVWISNPLDAFSHRDQRLYLDWLAGRPDGDAALRNASRVVLVVRDSAAARRLARSATLRAVAQDAHAVLYVKRR
jgi:hypothetical protein